MSSAAGQAALDRFVVVLHQPQDLVNIALVIRAMKNMGLRRLRLVSPAEYDAYRVTGIAHDTEDVVDAVEIFGDFDDAVADCVRVAATTARRRSSRQAWSDPETAAASLLDRSVDGDIAIVFGREDRGLPNDVLDRCHEAICIPTNPRHSSLNLGHAAVIVFYEIRRTVSRSASLETRDLSGKARDQAPPATAEQLEEFFRVWEEAMAEIGMFRGVDPTMKMRSYRRVLKRAELDGREIRLFEATAYRIVHFARRAEARIRDALLGPGNDGDGSSRLTNREPDRPGSG